MNVTTLGRGVTSGQFELKGYFRSPDTVFFTFLFPVLMLGIFGTAFASNGNVGELPDGTGGISMAAYYLPGLIAAALMLSGIQNLSIDIVREKHEGWLRRLGGTPLSPVSYFVGKAWQILTTSVLQVALLLAFAVLVFGVELPSDPDKWIRFAGLFLLGILTMTLLGVALSAIPRSTRSASAVVIPLVILLQFVSGVYLMFTMLPEWLQSVAAVFPLKWLAQGMRSVFLPDHFETLEPSGAWDLGLVVLNLAIWVVVGLVVSLFTFRWTRGS